MVRRCSGGVVPLVRRIDELVAAPPRDRWLLRCSYPARRSSSATFLGPACAERRWRSRHGSLSGSDLPAIKYVATDSAHRQEKRKLCKCKMDAITTARSRSAFRSRNGGLQAELRRLACFRAARHPGCFIPPLENRSSCVLCLRKARAEAAPPPIPMDWASSHGFLHLFFFFYHVCRISKSVLFLPLCAIG